MPEVKTSFHTKLGNSITMQGKYRPCPAVKDDDDNAEEAGKSRKDGGDGLKDWYNYNKQFRAIARVGWKTC